MTYVYNCDPCGNQFELRRPVDSRDEPCECPECGGAGRRVFGAGVQIKGAFWWGDWTGADLAPDPDQRPEFGRKCWPTSAYPKQQQMRGRF